jgi:hypothetical protein
MPANQRGRNQPSSVDAQDALTGIDHSGAQIAVFESDTWSENVRYKRSAPIRTGTLTERIGTDGSVLQAGYKPECDHDR